MKSPPTRKTAIPIASPRGQGYFPARPVEGAGDGVSERTRVNAPLKPLPVCARTPVIATRGKPKRKKGQATKRQTPKCQFPSGDPLEANFSLCGAPAHRGYSYCEAHCRVAYQFGFGKSGEAWTPERAASIRANPERAIRAIRVGAAR